MVKQLLIVKIFNKFKKEEKVFLKDKFRMVKVINNLVIHPIYIGITLIKDSGYVLYILLIS